MKLYQVDAFATQMFGGNPAAVVPLPEWVDAKLMQAIAAENNLAETAFFVKSEPGLYRLRWFTPTSEVDLCGHATLACAHVIFRFLAPEQEELGFQTRSGELRVSKNGERLAMALPSAASKPFEPPSDFADKLAKALNAGPPKELHFCEKGGGGAATIIAVWPSPSAVGGLKPSATLESVLPEVGARSLIATAGGNGTPYDFVSRFFAPALGVPEDPVTGSAHCALVPFWAKRLGKKKLNARQISPRGGDLLCTDDGARVILEGACALYLVGHIEI